MPYRASLQCLTTVTAQSPRYCLATQTFLTPGQWRYPTLWICRRCRFLEARFKLATCLCPPIKGRVRTKARSHPWLCSRAKICTSRTCRRRCKSTVLRMKTERLTLESWSLKTSWFKKTNYLRICTRWHSLRHAIQVCLKTFSSQQPSQILYSIHKTRQMRWTVMPLRASRLILTTRPFLVTTISSMHRLSNWSAVTSARFEIRAKKSWSVATRSTKSNAV